MTLYIIGNDDLDMWWKEEIGLDVVEQPIFICHTLDPSAGLEIMRVLSPSLLPVALLADTCWMLVRVFLVLQCHRRVRKSGRLVL
jgi:hypothetical protein